MDQNKKIVQLGPSQIEHFKRLVSYLMKSVFCVDTSETGAGKSYVAIAIATYFQFKQIVIVCPATATSVWNKLINEFSLPVILITTYESLSSKVNCQPKHGFLKRNDIEGKVSFNPTDAYLKIINEGVFVIFDEFQKLKNESSNMYKAAKAMIHPFVVSVSTISRLILVSASPFDKSNHPINMLKYVGVIRSYRLFTFHKETNHLELQGAQELVDFCNKYNPIVTQQIINQNPWSKKNVQDVCYLLYVNNLQKHITSSMPQPTKTFTKDVFNGYYVMRDKDKIEYIEGIKALHASLKYNKDTEGVNLKNMNLGVVTKSCMKIDRSKTYNLYRKVVDTLENIPNSKVIISVNFIFSIRALKRNLARYDPIIFTGSTTKSQREALISEFQEHNLNRRLFISTLRTGSVSVSLDDTSPGGIFPRHCFGLPSYMVMDIQQWTGRVFRYATTSQPHVCLMYGLVDDPNIAKEVDLTTAFIRETSISNALNRAGTVFEQTLEGQVKDGALFPNKYRQILENRDNVKFYDYIEVEQIEMEEKYEIEQHNNNIIMGGVPIIQPYSEMPDEESEDEKEPVIPAISQLVHHDVFIPPQINTTERLVFQIKK